MPATYEALSQGGHEAMATEIFTKIKAYLDTHGADSKVSKAGDTMTGPLVFKGINDAIQYHGTQDNYSMIKFIDNADDEYGNGISIGGGGTTIIGGGESSNVMAGSLSTGGGELMYIGNDSDVHIFTNLQNGWDSRKTFTFDTNGALTATKFIGHLQGTSDKSLYLSPSVSRPTNANQQGDYAGGLKKFLATSSMTANKPATDGHILHLSWDNNGGWDSQIFITNGNSPYLQIRGQSAGTWGSWKTIYHDGVIDVGNQASKTTFAYSKSGLAWGDFTYLAGWNGYELRAVHKNQITPAHIGAMRNLSYAKKEVTLSNGKAMIDLGSTYGSTHFVVCASGYFKDDASTVIDVGIQDGRYIRCHQNTASGSNNVAVICYWYY